MTELECSRKLTREDFLLLQRGANQHLVDLARQIQILTHAGADLAQIRATLYGNFVTKATNDIQISQHDYDLITTHELMLRILQAYSQRINQLQTPPVKDAEATK